MNPDAARAVAPAGAPTTLTDAAAAREGDLIRAAQRGDARAFEALYRAHAGRIYGLCLRMAADPARAEELTQDAFVRAWEKLGTFRQHSAFATWLHRLAVNVVLAAERSRRRREGRDAPGGDPAAADPVAAPGPGDRMDLERAIAALPSQARAVFVLHDVEGYKHREIARRMGISVGTSKAHLHRSRTLLRKALAS